MQNRLNELSKKVNKLEESIVKAISKLIEDNINIKVSSYKNLNLNYCRSRLTGSRSIGFDYYEIDLVDELDERVFGTTITLSYNQDEIRINTGSCGEFVVTDESKDNFYQTKKYILLGWLCENISVLKSILDLFDYSAFKEWYELQQQYDNQCWEAERDRKAEEERRILESLRIGNEYSIDKERITVKIVKMTDKRIYFESMFGTQKYYSKEDVVNYIKMRKFILVNGVE